MNELKICYPYTWRYFFKYVLLGYLTKRQICVSFILCRNAGKFYIRYMIQGNSLFALSKTFAISLHYFLGMLIIQRLIIHFAITTNFPISTQIPVIEYSDSYTI